MLLSGISDLFWCKMKINIVELKLVREYVLDIPGDNEYVVTDE